MRPHARFTILLALAMVPTSLASAEPLVTVDPVTLLENGEIAGCGLTSTVTSGKASAIGEMIAFRDGDRTAFAVRARPNASSDAIKSVRLATASHDTAVLFPPSKLLGDGLVETRTVLEGFAGSSFAQELMVMGGRFEFVTTNGNTIAYDLPRPMPHRVRQAYLNCAGDLFRPEAD
ncbi:MAG: hypothetical protein B7Y80_06195 [Hyphomicrobium sp. 32-62-53]|nr:MAG: hypothetical protein B7Z29_11925 [Hyphomicrobium sp. 12-62-95]OYY00811.1 MAG: hypothetical protein B7Y80_06195 [Hyphomicrobium sp. 32-62-53]